MNHTGGDCGCSNINSKKGGRLSNRSISVNHESKTALKKKTQKSSKRNIYSGLTEYKWGFGLEHELMFFHTPDDQEDVDKIKDFVICDIDAITTRILDDYKKYGLKYKDYDFLLNLPFEKSGRRCKGEWVFKPAIDYSMVEFVSTKPFSDFKKNGIKKVKEYINELLDQEERFIKILKKDPNCKKQQEKYGELWPHSIGMSSYIKVPTQKSRQSKSFTSYKFNKKMVQDYTGSYHITITLPFTKKTSRKVFIDRHINFSNQIQWIEPLLIGAFFSGNDTSMGTSSKKVRGSFRVMQVGWGNLAGSDVRKFNKGIGRYSNIKTYWRDNLHFKNIDRVKKCSEMSRAVRDESGAISSLSSDFRTFGSTDPKRPWHRESGKGMTVPNGVEIRIFDHFDTSYLEFLCYLIVYIAENSRVHKAKEYVYQNKHWIEAVHNVMENGYLARLSNNFIDLLRKNLGLKIKTKSRLIYKVFIEIQKELYKLHKNGKWTRLFINTNSKESDDVFRQLYSQYKSSNVNINKNSWDIGFILKMRNDRKFEKQFVKFINHIAGYKLSYDDFKDVFFTMFGKKQWERDIEHILYFLNRLNLYFIGGHNPKNKKEIEKQKLIVLSYSKDDVDEIKFIKINKKNINKSGKIINKINKYFRDLVKYDGTGKELGFDEKNIKRELE